MAPGDGLLYAVRVDDGRVLWTYPLKAEGLAKPRVVNGTVYVLGGNNVMHALNARSGKLLWVYNRREAGTLSIRGGSQPAVSGDLVLVGFSDGAMVALNKSSGALMWETSLNRNKRFRDVDASPVIDGGSGLRVFVRRRAVRAARERRAGGVVGERGRRRRGLGARPQSLLLDVDRQGDGDRQGVGQSFVESGEPARHLDRPDRVPATL